MSLGIEMQSKGSSVIRRDENRVFIGVSEMVLLEITQSLVTFNPALAIQYFIMWNIFFCPTPR